MAPLSTGLGIPVIVLYPRCFINELKINPSLRSPGGSYGCLTSHRLTDPDENTGHTLQIGTPIRTRTVTLRLSTTDATLHYRSIKNPAYNIVFLFA